MARKFRTRRRNLKQLGKKSRRRNKLSKRKMGKRRNRSGRGGVGKEGDARLVEIGGVWVNPAAQAAAAEDMLVDDYVKDRARERRGDEGEAMGWGAAAAVRAADYKREQDAYNMEMAEYDKAQAERKAQKQEAVKRMRQRLARSDARTAAAKTIQMVARGKKAKK